MPDLQVDITKCRHDGIELNVAAGCRPTEVVGTFLSASLLLPSALAIPSAIRCAEPRWAGVRYSLLANPPTFTGQTTMSNWIIEKVRRSLSRS